MTDLMWLVQLAVGTVLSVLGFLLKRALEDVGKKLADIAADVKEVRKEVGEHATRLASLEAKLGELQRRADETSLSVKEINTHGCARGCRPD